MFCPPEDEDKLPFTRSSYTDEEDPQLATFSRSTRLTPTFSRKDAKERQARKIIAKNERSSASQPVGSSAGGNNNVMSAFQSDEYGSLYGSLYQPSFGISDRQEKLNLTKKLLQSLSISVQKNDLFPAINRIFVCLSCLDFTKALYFSNEMLTKSQVSDSLFMEELGAALLLYSYAEYVFHAFDFIMHDEKDMCDMDDLVVKEGTKIINPVTLYEEAFDRISEITDFLVNATGAHVLPSDNFVQGTVETFWDGFLLSDKTNGTTLQHLISSDSIPVPRDLHQLKIGVSAEKPQVLGIPEMESYYTSNETIHMSEFSGILALLSDRPHVNSIRRCQDYLEHMCEFGELRLKLFRIYLGLRNRFDIVTKKASYIRTESYNIYFASKHFYAVQKQTQELVEICKVKHDSCVIPAFQRFAKTLLLESQLVDHITTATIDLSVFQLNRTALSLFNARNTLSEFIEYIESIIEMRKQTLSENADDDMREDDDTEHRLKRRNRSAPAKSRYAIGKSENYLDTDEGTERRSSDFNDYAAQNQDERTDSLVDPSEEPKKNKGPSSPSTSSKLVICKLVKEFVKALELRAGLCFGNVFLRYHMKPFTQGGTIQNRIEEFIKTESIVRKHQVLVGLVLDAERIAQVAECGTIHLRELDFSNDLAKDPLEPEKLLNRSPCGYFCPEISLDAIEKLSNQHLHAPVMLKVKEDGKSVSKHLNLEQLLCSTYPETQEVQSSDMLDIELIAKESGGMTFFPVLYESSSKLRHHMPNIVSILLTKRNEEVLDSNKPLLHKEGPKLENVCYRMERVDLAVTAVLIYKFEVDWKAYAEIIALIKGRCFI